MVQDQQTPNGTAPGPTGTGTHGWGPCSRGRALRWCWPRVLVAGHGQEGCQAGTAAVATSRARAARRSSSSFRVFEEAISGRAGSSYHSLLTPGRQEGERVPCRAPPRGPLACRASPTHPWAPQNGAGAWPEVGQGGQPPRAQPQCPAVPIATTAPQTAAPLHSVPRGEGRKGITALIHPAFSSMSLSSFWGLSHPKP